MGQENPENKSEGSIIRNGCSNVNNKKSMRLNQVRLMGGSNRSILES